MTQIQKKQPGSFRVGKTLDDLKHRRKAKNAENKRRRADYLNTPVDKRTEPFPYDTCNGKANRYVVTGKNGKPVYLH